MFNLKRHLLGIFFAFLIGLLYVSPFLIIPRMQKIYLPDQSNYRPISGDWNNYEGAPAKQVLQGRLIKKGYVWEHRNDSFIFPPLISSFLVGTNALVFGSLLNSFIFGRFLWNFLAAILIYIFMYLVTKKSFLSSMGMVFASLCAVQTLMGSQIKVLFSNFHNYKEALVSFINMLPNENFDYISLNFIFFLLAMIIFYLALKNSKKLYLIATAIIGGALFYTLPYYWTTFCGGIFLAVIYFLIKRDFKKSFNFTLILGLILIIGLPWLINYHFWETTSVAKDLIKSHGYFFGRNIDPLTVVYLFFLIFVNCILKDRSSSGFRAISFLLLSAIFLRNIQLIFGYSNYPCGWTVKVADILIYILFFYFIYSLIQHNYRESIFPKNIAGLISKYYKPFGMFFVLFVFIFSFWHKLNISFDPEIYRNQVFSPGYFEAYQWLDNNTEKDSTVLTLYSRANDDLITMTHNFPFCAFFNYNLYNIAEKERLDRFYIACKLTGVNNNTFRDFLELTDNASKKKGAFSEKEWGTDLVYSEAVGLPVSLFIWKYKWYKPFYNYNFDRRNHIFEKGILERVEKGEAVIYIPQDVKAKLADDYANFTNEIPELLKVYRLDYILVGLFEKQIGSVEGLEENNLFETVYKNQFVKIFKVKK